MPDEFAGHPEDPGPDPGPANAAARAEAERNRVAEEPEPVGLTLGELMEILELLSADKRVALSLPDGPAVVTGVESYEDAIVLTWQRV